MNEFAIGVLVGAGLALVATAVLILMFGGGL